MDVAEFLEEVPLFEGMSRDDVGVIAQRVRQRRYRSGDRIFHRDDPGVAMYVICSGKVKIHNELADGSERIIAILADGDIVGELSVIDGETRSANATTLEATELLMLTREDLRDIIQRHTRISLHLLETMAGRLRRTTHAFQVFSNLDVRGRLAMQLLRLAEQHGIVTRDGVRIDVPLTQTDLAALIGSVRETVNRELVYLREKKYIATLDQRYHVIRNEAALRKLCDMPA